MPDCSDTYFTSNPSLELRLGLKVNSRFGGANDLSSAIVADFLLDIKAPKRGMITHWLLYSNSSMYTFKSFINKSYKVMWSCQESNLDLKFRKLLFYPLNYKTFFLRKFAAKV